MIRRDPLSSSGWVGIDNSDQDGTNFYELRLLKRPLTGKKSTGFGMRRNNESLDIRLCIRVHGISWFKCWTESVRHMYGLRVQESTWFT